MFMTFAGATSVRVVMQFSERKTGYRVFHRKSARCDWSANRLFVRSTGQGYSCSAGHLGSWQGDYSCHREFHKLSHGASAKLEAGETQSSEFTCEAARRSNGLGPVVLFAAACWLVPLGSA